MSKKYYYIANWKMYWNFVETVKFVTENYDSLVTLSNDPDAKIILCPSVPTLHTLAQKFVKTNIALGGQDCSDYNTGAYTGQVSAEHLQTAGAQYCIIGHSERRKYNAETDEMIAHKCLALLQAGLTPIICIGETLEQNQQDKTLSVLESQLEMIVKMLNENKTTIDLFPSPTRMVRQAQDERVSACARGESVEPFERENMNFERSLISPNTLIIAYEPVWAIGTGLIPTLQQLASIFTWLSDFVAKNFSGIQCSLIYGGSTASKNIQELKTVDLIDGFLIGGASLDCEEFAKIVKSSIKDSL